LSPNIISDQVKKDEMGNACSTQGEKRNVCGKARREETTRKAKA
jgi:hypothetical protein